MHENTEKTLTRDCAATRIPSGETITLAKDTTVFITQALGGSYTVATDQGLARIADEDADALGLESAQKGEGIPVDSSIVVDEKAVWDQLRTCYDPEIPVNIVDLGLVYDCVITPRETNGARIDIKMTLTAPGCGMGPVIASEAKSKYSASPVWAMPKSSSVWDPPWNQAMISETGKMKLGLI